ncbi:jerky protein homolog-like [Centruroides sculpturatus]|uniref:jerky protein homolog-like n=1 Tax=Centruroides sculpturatus TaxID=218467 RepID=UPI000C6D3A09|nr:jerky protein homolog-like [Centruroides sculpturatus]
MSSKRKRVVLSLKDKLDIINALKRGESGRSLSDKYGVGTSTISDIKKQSEKIMKFTNCLMSEDGTSDRKVMKKSRNEEVEECLFMWFIQRRSCGQPISGPLLCEKAIFFNTRLNGDPTFKASSGWLEKFKRRHGIRELEVHGEKLSADIPSANTFIDTLKEFVEKEGFDEEFIYNADETGLNWKQLPNKSLASRRENTASGYKTSKERVTIMVCANATGRHRLPLLVIGKSKNPRCFKNIRSLPVEYDHQKKAWINGEIFKRWYEKQFIPEVKKYQNSIDKRGITLLLLDSAPSHPSDNAPSHPSIECLKEIDEMFTVKFRQPNVTSVIQPMDQGVIETVKRLYRKQMLRRLLLADENNEETFISFHKKINLKDCCYMAAESWNSVDVSTLRKSWNKILKRPLEHFSNIVENTVESGIGDIAEVITQISICAECDEEDVSEWLNCDVNDPGLQILSEEEIIQEISASDEQDREDEEEICEVRDIGPTHSEAFQCLDVAMKWFESQEECNSGQLICLKSIRDLAASKRIASFKQKSIIEFLNKK